MTLIFQYGQKYIFKGRNFQKPDSQEISMISDFGKNTDLATFLDSGEILMKIKNRFMIFDKYGEFIDEVEFKDLK